MKLAVFCSSKPSLVPIFRQDVEKLIPSLEASGHFTAFVYGGGSSGLMGLVREYATIPVIGHNLPRWDPLPGEFVYDTLRERQSALVDDSDAYLILAGGVGTLSELFQVLCENDVEKRDKPVFVYDPCHVYAPLEDLLRKMYENQYVTLPPKFFRFSSIESLLNALDQIFSE